MKEISVEELKINPSTLIGKEWALLTAGNKDGYKMCIRDRLKVVSYNACPAYTVGESLVSAGDKPPCIRVIMKNIIINKLQK